VTFWPNFRTIDTYRPGIRFRKQKEIPSRGKLGLMTSKAAEENRLTYLDALGIDVWRARGEAEPIEEPEVAVDAVISGGWDEIRSAVSGCTKCALHRTRTKTVFGIGAESADWMIIGEAPGAEEDRRGEPFVGKAGKLLDEMLLAVGLSRQTVFIANILKCRPPQNRDPSVEEATQCRAYLNRQIELLKPKLILAVGRIAAQNLLGIDAPLGSMRGELYNVGPAKVPTVVTYHPAYLLRSPSAKRKVWQDLCMALNVANQSRNV
jgi:uracil-DNA glycosylase family 4